MSFKALGLYEFLVGAELQQYYCKLKNDLKVQNISQLKWVTEEDLCGIGMSKPESRRMKKLYSRYHTHNYFCRVRNILLGRRDDSDNVSPFSFLNSFCSNSSKLPKSSPRHIISADAITVNKQLGAGEFGVVQQGVWTNDDGYRTQVAIKCLSNERMHSNPIDFLKEATILHNIQHEHIVRLYGVVLDSGSLMLVTELAPLRSLLECLKETSLRPNLSVLTLCGFAEQICDGMRYLESKRLIHRDLAARNILVFSKNTVKISDFGLSRMLGVGKDYYQTNFNVNLKLPMAWCAPECINFLRFTSASDVWAFGVTLWEMFSYGFQPWAALTGQQILEAIDEPSHQRLERPDSCPREYYDIMLQCWQHEPQKRPDFLELSRRLPDCKPEQVRALQAVEAASVSGPGTSGHRWLPLKAGSVVTVLDKTPVPQRQPHLWRGCTDDGRTGLFNPSHCVTHVAGGLPASGRNSSAGRAAATFSSTRRRLHPDMISRPRNDLQHTLHVGSDGCSFGDVSFLAGRYHSSDSRVAHGSKVAPLFAVAGQEQTHRRNGTTPHVYQEISGGAAAAATHAADPFDLGPSLMDEMMSALETKIDNSAQWSRDRIASDESTSGGEMSNVCNEIREQGAKYMRNGDSGCGVRMRDISESDRRNLEQAIAMANQLAAKSMAALNDIESPTVSPKTPSGLSKKFTFRFRACSPSLPATRRNFSVEAASIAPVHTLLGARERQAYDALVQGDVFKCPPPVATVVPTRVPSTHCQADRCLSFGTAVAPVDSGSLERRSRCRRAVGGVEGWRRTSSVDGGLNIGSVPSAPHALPNALPLPPRDRSRSAQEQELPRHHRRHPLLLPAAAAQQLPLPQGEPPLKPPRLMADGDLIGSACRGHDVSCEELLEFAADGPNWRRTRGPAHGAGSDEVRIMLKVLGDDADADSEAGRQACLDALHLTDWHVHRAIKVRQAAAAVKADVPLAEVVSALDRADWNINKAVGALMACHGAVGEATVV